ncbi:MAG: M48 family metallopeptidase [Actinomycetota bacterium]
MLEHRDIYSLVQGNRRRLFSLFALFAFLVMALSGIGIYLLQRVFVPEVDFWMILCLFWLLYALQVLVRFALGGNWVLHKVSTLPPSMSDPRLQNALQAARLAAGLQNKVRLLEVPKQDINSFSLALPDGSHVVLLTTGVAVKLPAREREALAAHELAHIATGDTTVQSAMLRLVGPGGSPADASTRFPGLPRKGLPPAFLTLFILLVLVTAYRTGPVSPPVHLYALALFALFAALSASLPFLLHRIMRLLLSREREYYADLLAAYWLRDPEAVHLALKHASEDVLDLLLLPSNLDAILFHPVVDYTSYRPFQTQPTMAERQRRLEERFPSLSSL